MQRALAVMPVDAGRVADRWPSAEWDKPNANVSPERREIQKTKLHPRTKIEMVGGGRVKTPSSEKVSTGDLISLCMQVSNPAPPD